MKEKVMHQILSNVDILIHHLTVFQTVIMFWIVVEIE